MENKLYLISDIVKMCGKSQKYIRKQIAEGKLKAYKEAGHYVILSNDYDAWLKLEASLDNNDEEIKISKNISQDIINWVDVSDDWDKDGWINSSYRNGFNFIDLFAGAGGLGCGLTMAGFNPVGCVEIMPQAVETYRYNFAEQKGFHTDVETRDIRESSVKEFLYKSVEGKHIHLISGGFPCQGFSMSGNRVVTDPRNSLYLEMLSIVKHLQPDFVVMENVEGLRSMLNGKIEEKIISDYKSIGYDINVAVLNSADYGVAQVRKRVIFIGNRHNLVNYHPKPILDNRNYISVGECISKYMDINEDKSINHIFTKHTEEMKLRLANVKEGRNLYDNYADAWKKPYWDRPSFTVKENHGGVFIHPKCSRVMTPRELAALQSFPDDFIFKGSKKWQLVQIGNAVPCLLGKAIGIAVMKSLKEIYK